MNLYKKGLVLLLFSVLSYGQKSKLKIVEFVSVQNAVYGYTYILPANLQKELIEAYHSYEFQVYNSMDNSFRIKIFSEDNFAFSERIQELNKYYNKIKEANHAAIEGASIIKSVINNEENSFTITGKNENEEFIWKTIMCKVPVSGEFGFNTMIFYSSKSKKNRNLGLKLINEFKNF
ncbi:hypothetical protein [Flavobacterium reichenbachii]|uniref:Uncharacterized protein n=1 Tax=Flavobacterium reichenbachii TaxID=362418 RepID=A0A085ZQE7_9FLAO|nr:hypothetical protein [Flavobacterium reichenbachii]KFF06661.1 hypothetical protein IW19_14600 [Flavobacterium reichenbachii]OXB18735.1 hypothetical protein B0A68_01600 [Flavobacterium reichenbachii]